MPLGSEDKMTKQLAREILGVDYTADEEAIKKAYKGLVPKTHPDRFRDTPEEQQKTEEMQRLNVAYALLIHPDAGSTEVEFSPDWKRVMESELHPEASAAAVATSDTFKPTIQEFFLSLNRNLHRLERIAASMHEEESVATFEDISLEQQRSNKTYLLEFIAATAQIGQLLQGYINTSSPDHWRVTETLRKAQLMISLANQFRRFGSDRILHIRDAGTFHLMEVLLNHLAFLRYPLRNFKSTEDLYFLTLLDDVAEDIRSYHDQMLSEMSKFHSGQLLFGGGKIYGKMHAIKDRIHFGDPAIVLSAEEASSIKGQITSAIVYVLRHCHYPDNSDIYEPATDKRVFQFGSRGMLIGQVISAMFLFNDKVRASGLDEGLCFPREEIGYESFEAHQNETQPRLDLARNGEKSVERTQTHVQFLPAQGIRPGYPNEYYLDGAHTAAAERTLMIGSVGQGEEEEEDDDDPQDNPTLAVVASSSSASAASVSEQSYEITEQTPEEQAREVARNAQQRNLDNDLVNQTLLPLNRVFIGVIESGQQANDTRRQGQEIALNEVELDYRGLCDLRNLLCTMLSRAVQNGNGDIPLRVSQWVHDVAQEFQSGPNRSVSYDLILTGFVDCIDDEAFRQSLQWLLTEFTKALKEDPSNEELRQKINTERSNLYKMLMQVLDPSQSSSQKTYFVKQYKDQCKSSPWTWKNFGKAILVLCSAALGAIIGAAVGLGIGIAAGIWSGPGAAISGGLGFFSGAAAGASAGVLAGTAVTGLTSASLSGYLLFKPSPMEKARKEVINAASEKAKVAPPPVARA